MKIDLDILTGVAVPVFALSVAGQRPVLAWNAGMVKMTGTPADKALGFSPKAVFGPGAAALMTADQPGNLFLEGLGTVSVILQGGLLVGTLTDHERDAFIGLAAQDLRAHHPSTCGRSRTGRCSDASGHGADQADRASGHVDDAGCRNLRRSWQCDGVGLSQGRCRIAVPGAASSNSCGRH